MGVTTARDRSNATLMPSTEESRLDTLLEPLKVPKEYAHYEKLVDADIITRLEQWKQKTHAALSELKELVVATTREPAEGKGEGERESEQLSVREQARIVSAVAPFDGEGPWIASDSRDVSKGTYEAYTSSARV